ncbi:MAG: hypothetical protein AAFQ98_20880, partial [Bacteroidota bacterium]
MEETGRTGICIVKIPVRPVQAISPGGMPHGHENQIDLCPLWSVLFHLEAGPPGEMACTGRTGIFTMQIPV